MILGLSGRPDCSFGGRQTETREEIGRPLCEGKTTCSVLAALKQGAGLKIRQGRGDTWLGGRRKTSVCPYSLLGTWHWERREADDWEVY